MHSNHSALSAGGGLILLNVKSLFAVFTIECSAVQVSARVQCRADSASLVQCFSKLCRLYLMKIVFRIFLSGVFCWGQIFFFYGRDDILHIQCLMY